MTESSNFVEITLKKKVLEEIEFGIRTRDGSAKAGDDYIGLDETIYMGRDEYEKIVRVIIIDDNEWEPDEDFYIELYDLKNR